MEPFLKSLIKVTLSALLFSFLGATLGFFIGAFTPGYYRAVFTEGNAPDFVPAEVGLGLGATQGMVGGILVGLILVFVQTATIEGLRTWFGKYKRPVLFIASGLVLLLAFVFWQGVIFTRELAKWTYANYVAEEYMPAQRRLTGKWPTNMLKFPSHVNKQERRTEVYYRERLKRVWRFHYSNFKNLEVMKADSKKFTYLLHLGGQTLRCESDLESGFCETQ